MSKVRVKLLSYQVTPPPLRVKEKCWLNIIELLDNFSTIDNEEVLLTTLTNNKSIFELVDLVLK